MNNNLNYLILIFFFLLVQIGYQTEEDLKINPVHVESASYIIKYNYTLKSSYGNLSKATINISIPPNSKVLFSSHNYSILKDDFENNFLLLSHDPSSNEVNFSVDLLTTINASHLYSLNYSDFYYAPSNLDNYLQNLSLNITSIYYSDFEKIAALAIYVHNLIDYDINFFDKSYSPQEILKIKKGVCTHYALLFSSLAQSLGYKTRYVHGFAYSSKAGGWIGHVWVEVYLGKWVGVDPTWLEVGFIDATHIPFFRSYSLDFKLSSATAYIEKDANLQIISLYETKDFFENAKNILPLSLNLSEKNYIKNVIVSNEVINPLSQLVLIANLSNSPEYTVTSVKLHSCTDQFNNSFFEFLDDEQYFILQPSKEFYFFSIGKFNQDFQFYNKEKASYYVLKCPIIIEDKIFEQSIIKEIELNPTARPLKKAEAQLLRLTIDITQKQNLFVDSNSSEKFFVVGENIFLFNDSLSPSFVFYPSKFGKNKVVVFSKSSEPVELVFYVQKIENLISNISVPRVVMGSTPFVINITFDKNISNSNLTLVVGLANNYQSSRVNNTSVSVELQTDKIGEFFIIIYLKDEQGRILYSDSIPLKVIQKPFIFIKEISIKNKNNFFYTNFKFEYSGEFSYSQLYLDEEKYILDKNKNNLEIILSKKPRVVKLVWFDLFNNSYVITKDISSLNVVEDLVEVRGEERNILSKSFFDLLSALVVFSLAIILFIKIYKYYKIKKENSNKDDYNHF
ncbi:MAG: transglutaminase-like domain-containing protein [Candidatus Anstonellaceae archaeon]